MSEERIPPYQGEAAVQDTDTGQVWKWSRGKRRTNRLTVANLVLGIALIVLGVWVAATSPSLFITAEGIFVAIGGASMVWVAAR